MTYEGNMLTSVRDDAHRSVYAGATDFDGVPGQEYPLTYNDAGSLTSDAGRRIAWIDYDLMNNPVRIQFTNGSVTRYVYSAAGEKLRVTYQTAVPNITVPIGSTRELAFYEIQYTDSTDYLLGGSLTLKNGRIDKYQFEEGYCQAEQYVYNTSQDKFTFCYYDRDHLGSIRQVTEADGTGSGYVIQRMNYYPFGAEFCDGSTSSNVQSHRYNGKEFDKMHGLNTYDYGARQYNPVTARWDRMDPLCEKYYSMSPYNYCGNNPINAIDEEGKLTIFINGFHSGWGGARSSYWNGFDKSIIQHFNEKKTPIYFDGSLGGAFALSFSTGKHVYLSNGDLMPIYDSNLFCGTRYSYGYKQGKKDAERIINSLERDNGGNITETIRIVSHSMGAAYSKGFAQALMDYIYANPKTTSGIRLVEYDFAPFQPYEQKAVKGVDTYQYSHHYDRIAHDKMIGGAHFKTSYDSNKGHSISDFFDYISQLPEGHYVVINGKIVKR